MEGGAAVETALSLVGDVLCVPAKVCPIGWSFALSTAAAVVKNYPLSLCPVSAFPTSSLHINNCLGIIGVDHMCQPVRFQGHCFSQYIEASCQVSQLLSQGS